MSFDKRLWQSGVLALVATLIFSIFIYQVNRWSLADVAVSGQSEETGTGVDSGAATTRIVPQIVAGSFDGGASTYSTVIQIINPTTTAVSLTATFYNQDGSASTLPMATNSQTSPNFTGTLTATVPMNGVFVITTNPVTLEGPGVMQWGKIATSAAVTIVSSLEVQGIIVPGLRTRVGRDASEGTLRRFVIPRTRNTTTGRDAGFAVVNTGTTAATLNAALKDADGTNLALTAATFQPGEQKSAFAGSFFTGALPGTSNYQYIVFEGSAAQFAAIGLSIQGENLSSVPVTKLE